MAFPEQPYKIASRDASTMGQTQGLKRFLTLVEESELSSFLVETAKIGYAKT